MATLRFNPEAFARSNACIVLGVLLVMLTAYTFYRAIFDPTLHCHLCLLMALPPLATSLLWSVWLLAWHVPHWQTTSMARRWSLVCSALASFAFAAYFFMQ
jgi:hypothetical protein